MAVKATLLLCDAAQVCDGKLYILGGGWSMTVAGMAPMAIAMRLELAWSEAPTPHHWELVLQDESGEQVTIETPDGPQPVEIRGDFQLGTPQGVPLGSDIPLNLAVTIGPLPLPANSRYRWQLVIDGEAGESWQAQFSTLAPPQFAPQGGPQAQVPPGPRPVD